MEAVLIIGAYVWGGIAGGAVIAAALMWDSPLAFFDALLGSAAAYGCQVAGAYGRDQLARSLMWTSIIMFTGAAGCLAIVRFF